MSISIVYFSSLMLRLESATGSMCPLRQLLPVVVGESEIMRKIIRFNDMVVGGDDGDGEEDLTLKVE